MKQLIFCLIILFSFSLYAHHWHEAPKLTYNDLLSVSVPEDSISWVCGKGGSVFLTTDAGNNWIDRSNNEVFGNLDLVHIFGYDKNIAFIIANTDKYDLPLLQIFRTNDQGLNWTNVLSIPKIQGNSIFLFDNQRGAFIGNPVEGKWPVWITADCGLTWDSTGVNIPPPSTDEVGYVNGLFGLNRTNSLFFGSNKGRYFMSKDFGNTWEADSISITEVHCIAFVDSLTGVMAGTGLLKTRDGRQTWKDDSFVAPGTGTFNAIMAHDFWHVFLTREGDGVFDFGNHVFHSGNLCDSNWDTSYTAMDLKPFLNIAQARKGGSFYGVRQGGGLTIGIHEEGEATAVSDYQNTPFEHSLNQNYPNPFNPATIINYSISQNSFVTLNIYDVLGQIITTLVNEEKPAGIYNVSFNASDLPSGFYIYEMRSSGGFSMSRKMLLVK